MENKVILEKILKYCDMLDETLEEYENDYMQFKSSHIFQNSACMCLLQIGELCKCLTKPFRDKYNNVDWKGWCGLRDVFAHQYGRIDVDENWNTIVSDYPIFKKGVKELLDSLSG